MQTVNPATGQPIREYPNHTPDEVEARLVGADDAFDQWRHVPLEERGERLRAAAEQLRGQRQQYARLMAEEMGKPIRQAEAELEKCERVCHFYADRAADFLSSASREMGDARAYVRFDPLGPVLAIMPWNFPFWQVFRFAAPALMAGNVVLLKHAPNVTGCALAIEDIFYQTGYPEGTLSTLLIDDERVSEVIAHPAVQAVTLTGSGRAGSAVASQAGRHLKKTVLELGGSDPFLVLADCDLSHVVEQALRARTTNTGQSCIAAKRFIVEAEIADDFTDALVERMSRLRVGDPLDPETDLGPLAREDLLETLHDQVTRSTEAGARLLTGGQRIPREGFFYAPTVLADVRPGMPAFDEETFGPVAAIITARHADEAVALANRTEYGLGASIWTRDTQRAEMLAAEIESGAVFVNEIVQSDPSMPFGGIKQSGYGRELAAFGMHEFTNIKTVWIKHLDIVQEASEESFPASDPPAWAPGTTGGRH